MEIDQVIPAVPGSFYISDDVYEDDEDCIIMPFDSDRVSETMMNSFIETLYKQKTQFYLNYNELIDSHLMMQSLREDFTHDLSKLVEQELNIKEKLMSDMDTFSRKPYKKRRLDYIKNIHANVIAYENHKLYASLSDEQKVSDEQKNCPDTD